MECIHKPVHDRNRDETYCSECGEVFGQGYSSTLETPTPGNLLGSFIGPGYGRNANRLRNTHRTMILNYREYKQFRAQVKLNGLCSVLELPQMVKNAVIYNYQQLKDEQLHLRVAQFYGSLIYITARQTGYTINPQRVMDLLRITKRDFFSANRKIARVLGILLPSDPISFYVRVIGNDLGLPPFIMEKAMLLALTHQEKVFNIIPSLVAKAILFYAMYQEGARMTVPSFAKKTNVSVSSFKRALERFCEKEGLKMPNGSIELELD